MKLGGAYEGAKDLALAKRYNGDALRQETWDKWRCGWLRSILQDIRFALRVLARNRVFTIVSVLTLALGIGVNTAIFSIVDEVLLWSIPAREPGRLVELQGGYSNTYPFYSAYRDRNQVFSSLFASSHNLTAGIRPSGAPVVEVGHVQYISGNYFQALQPIS